MNSVSNEGMKIYDIKKELEDQIQIIFRDKILTKDNKEMLRHVSMLLYCVDTIETYIESKGDE